MGYLRDLKEGTGENGIFCYAYGEGCIRAVVFCGEDLEPVGGDFFAGAGDESCILGGEGAADVEGVAG